MTQKDILLVEDNPDDVELTRLAFQEANVANQLVVVADGAEALDYLFARGKHAHRNPAELPSIVLLDLKLPKLDGWDLLQRLKADASMAAVPVIVVTGDSQLVQASSLRAGRGTPAEPSSSVAASARCSSSVQMVAT